MYVCIYQETCMSISNKGTAQRRFSPSKGKIRTVFQVPTSNPKVPVRTELLHIFNVLLHDIQKPFERDNVADTHQSLTFFRRTYVQ